MEHTPANYITLARFFAIPVIAVLLVIATPAALWAAAALFIVAAGTDWLDGYVARRTDTVSNWGIAMDPIGDKALVVLILFMLAAMGAFTSWGMLAGFVILFREVIVPGLREFFIGRGISTPVTTLAKWKTASQLTAMSVFIIALAMANGTLAYVGEGLLLVAAVLTAITGWQYYKNGMEQVKNTK